MSGAGELLARVYADPADDAPRAVYADFLLEKGDALGEFIHFQLARARGKKGLQAKEKRIFDPTWWKGHPIAGICGAIRWEDTHRGFPSVLRPAVPVSEPDRAEFLATWKPFVGHPGWSTTREMVVYSVDSEVLASIVRGTPMPVLERMSGVGPIVLAALAGLDLPLRELGVYGHTGASLPDLSSLRGLASLDWTTPYGLERGVERARALGVLERITELSIGTGDAASLVGETLDMLDALPENIQLLRVRGTDLDCAEARRGGRLELNLVASSVEEIADVLAATPAKRISSLRVTFDGSGFFTKRNRPALRKRMEAATAHFPSRELDLGPAK